MRMLIVGIGDAFSRQWYGSSALIDAPHGTILLDAPGAVDKAVHEASRRADWDVDLADVNDILITHLHADHCSGIESVAYQRFFRRQADPVLGPLRVHMIEPVAERFWERCAPSMDGRWSGANRTAADFFDIRVMAHDEPVDIAGLRCCWRMTRHPIPCIGLVFSDGHRTIGWSGDTPFELDHIDWLREADVIVHECNVGAAHTPIESLNQLPDDVRSRMRLIHIPDDFDPDSTDIRPLEQGEVLE